MTAPQGEVAAMVRESLRQSGAELAVSTRRRIEACRRARRFGWTHEQIGEQLGVSEAAVRSLLKRNPEVLS